VGERGGERERRKKRRVTGKLYAWKYLKVNSVRHGVYNFKI
jgi:hypothetical protein